MTESLRSASWFGPRDLGGFIHRTSIRAEGFSSGSLAGKPVIGICNSWSELVSCNLHFRALAEAVKRGVWEAGGFPLEFSTISLGENLMKPTAMMFRNLMAMDVEESIRAYPLDGVVLLGGCDKTVPAQLMGAVSVGLPTIMVTGGPSQPAVFRGHRLGSGTDLWRYADDVRAGRMSPEEFSELEAAAIPSVGHCPEMGTAATMACLVEALGLSLPGTAAIPAVDARRFASAEATGRRAVQLVREDLRPSQVLTSEAFDNAITALVGLGGSTNAVLHLLALAGRAGVGLELRRFGEIAAKVPLLANLRPAGQHLFEQLFEVGGVPALMRVLLPLLARDAVGVDGRSVAERVDGAPDPDGNVLAKLEDPFKGPGGLAVLSGNLAPRGAIIKRSAASGRFDRHRGPALVFDDIHEAAERIDAPDLDVTADTVLILRNAGPRGGPGMPEWAALPIPAKLLRQGVTDMVRISDARMSGTAFGTVILHVTPEASVGGPLGAVRTGDQIILDLDAGRLDVDLEPDVLEQRMVAAPERRRPYERGYGRLFLDHVLQADEGCDFDFLRGRGPAQTLPLGLHDGWIGGW
jgi:dihydroxy-acid dehydratase